MAYKLKAQGHPLALRVLLGRYTPSKDLNSGSITFMRKQYARDEMARRNSNLWCMNIITKDEFETNKASIKAGEPYMSFCGVTAYLEKEAKR